MAAYLCGNVRVTDPEGFKDYSGRVVAVVAAYGGRYLARGGAVELLEGDVTPNRAVLIEFNDMASLKAFYNSAEYRPLLALRMRTAVSNIVAVEGL